MRKELPKKKLAQRRAIADRLRKVQELLFGDRGAPRMARSVGVSYHSWHGWLARSGSPIPATTILKVFHVHGVEPKWLHDGTGPIFRAESEGGSRAILRASVKLLFEAAHELPESSIPADPVIDLKRLTG